MTKLNNTKDINNQERERERESKNNASEQLLKLKELEISKKKKELSELEKQWINIEKRGFYILPLSLLFIFPISEFFYKLITKDKNKQNFEFMEEYWKTFFKNITENKLKSIIVYIFIPIFLGILLAYVDNKLKPWSKEEKGIFKKINILKQEIKQYGQIINE